MAERLGHHLSQDCFIARLSGDAFGLLGHEQALSPERLRKVLAEPYRIDGAEHAVAVSSGIVRLRDSGPSGQSVIKDATIARKQAREKGVNSDAYYSPNLGLQAKERTHLLQQLQNAFEHEQLFPVFQPQVRLADGRVIGFESLMRWRDASGAMLPPDRFIPLAEQSGLIVGMGTWILRAALRELGRLGAEGWPGLRMAVNVSAVQFRMPDFVEVVRRALDETGVDPHQLELEITESVAMMGQGMVVDVLGRLREMGIGLAIDDFGTGFSSLSYLDRLPLDRIKIDRAFVQAMGGEGEGKRIADVIIQLGHSLDLEIIAEGVERDTQAIRLRELGCHEAQGYFFGKPMTADALRAWLRDDVANPRA
jgi:EAL domain-containing protein (putative c-di-GMP-specific phosphodiesterase class I)